MDITAYTPRLPQPGETLFGHSFITVPGGKGANQAVAAARLGAPTKMTGRVGDDGFGEEVLRAITANGVDMQAVAIDAEHDTALAMIAVDDTAQNAIIVISGANMALDDSDVQRCLPHLDQAHVLLLQLEVPLEANLAVARAAQDRNVKVILDPAPATALPAEMYALADVITPSEIEAAMLLGYEVTPLNALAAARELCDRGADAAIVKLGERGVFYFSEAGEGTQASFEVEAVDTVAAGDAFNGGLAVALAEGRSFPEAVRWASASGAIAVTRPGAAPAMPHRHEVEALLARAEKK